MSEQEQVANLMMALLGQDKLQRQQAEEQLNQAKGQENFVSTLLRLCVLKDAPQEVQQIAAINLKNFAKRFWENPAGDEHALPEADKKTIRENLLEAIVISNPRVQTQLTEAMRFIITSDYPDNLPNLSTQVKQALESNQQAGMLGGLLVARLIVRKYEYKQGSENKPAAALQEYLLPASATILQKVIDSQSPDEQAATFLRLCLKIFWSSIYLNIPACLLNEELCDSWIQSVHRIMSMKVPDNPTDDLNERETQPWWKTKKWAVHTAQRLLYRYGQASDLKHETDKKFSAMFNTKYSITLLQSCASILAQHEQGEFVSKRVLQLSMKYIENSIDYGAMYKRLKQHLRQLIQNIIFPILCWCDDDGEDFYDDPQEFIRKSQDIMTDLYGVRPAAMSLLHDICKKRGKEFTPFVLNIIVTTIQTYLQQQSQTQQQLQGKGGSGDGSDPSEKVARAAFGSLYALTHIPRILKRKAYRSNIDSLLGQAVYPCMSSQHAFIRYQAIQASKEYASSELEGGQGPGSLFVSLMKGTVEGMNDQQLPVRLESLVALKYYIKALHDVNGLKPIIPDLLTRLFAVVNEVESEDAVYTLETLVSVLGEDIQPYAADVIRELVKQFDRVMNSEDEEQEDDDEFIDQQGARAGFAILTTIMTVLESLEGQPDVMTSLEPLLLPLIKKYCNEEGTVVFEEVCSIANYLIFVPNNVSPDVWSIWQLLEAATCDWAEDYIKEIYLPLDSFISYGTEVFVNSTEPAGYDYLKSTVKIAQAMLSGDIQDSEKLPGPQLLALVFLACKGHERVKLYMEPILKLMLEALSNTADQRLTIKLLNIVSSSLYYDANATLQLLRTMDGGKWFQVTLEKWLVDGAGGTKNEEHIKVFDYKVCLLGILSVFNLQDAQLSPELNENALQQLLQTFLRVLKNYVEHQSDSEVSSQDDYETSDEELVSDDDGDADASGQSRQFADDQDIRDTDGDDYIKKLEQIQQQMQSQQEMQQEGEGDELNGQGGNVLDFNSLMLDFHDDVDEYQTILNDVDVLMTAADVLNTWQQNRLALFDAPGMAMTMADLQELISRRREEIAQKEANNKKQLLDSVQKQNG